MLAQNKLKAMELDVAKLKSLVKVGLSKPILGYWDIRGLGQAIRY